ncbi:C40 family peptidase [Calidifontimicrobium sp. SYSU G02091]|uniref:C40 family peptidase n=1 Tax=Calidifontimicrobium sp. SYSU G02091 TaxID=2926421 RepID=UPI001F53E1E9|nr:C40 family peptidase [Calidifontimicrobium sp. SYSU G02091]MCI1192663.1 C40 family peptidase [Calidifontimicrobium sp. SYSU G02091]
MATWQAALVSGIALVLAGCASAPRPPAPVPAAGDTAAEAAAVHAGLPEVVLAAMSFLDRPYVRAGNGETGFDCSGFTRHVFDIAAGVQLPRRAHEQAHASGLVGVPRDALRPGDLVFFNTLQRPFSHVGVYIGEHRFIHAPRVGAQVRIEDMRVDYWARRFDGARRAVLGGAERLVRAEPALAPAADRP